MGICVAFRCQEIGKLIFPSDAKLRRKWEKALRRVNFKATRHSRLCWKHFKESDFKTSSKIGFPLIRKRLKESAVPSIFSWNEISDKGTIARSKRLQNRNDRYVKPSTLGHDKLSVNSSVVTDLLANDLSLAPKIEVLTLIKEESIKPSPKEYNNQSTQTPLLSRIFSLDELLADDESVYYYTGLESHAKFKLVMSTLCPMAYNLKYKGSEIVNIRIEYQYLLMLMKLRRNKCDFELAKYFGISEAMVSNIFVTWLNFTYEIWLLIDTWPECDLVDYYMPSEFKMYADNSRIIIHEFEIPIVKPTNPASRKATLSLRKSKNTLKFFVGATPGGLLNYCSEGFVGSASDEQMIQQSDLREKCESGNGMIVHSSFNLQHMSFNRDIEMNIPALTQEKSQTTGNEVKQEGQLRSQSIHMEHLLALTKTFTILKSDLNPLYVPFASRIFFVCFMLSNFQERVKNNKKT